MHRRQFIQQGAAVVSLAAVSPKSLGANDRVNAAVMGVRGRGNGLLHAFAEQADVDIRYVCDVDENVLRERMDAVSKKTRQPPRAITDFRVAIEDPAVDVLVIGTPDHWHAIPTILACQAGKDVYVEKPDGHNMLEGRTMVKAMRKHQRIVQLGTQSRSGKHFLSAMEFIREGHLGKARFARAWESARQGSLGFAKDEAPPSGVDYDFWLGSARKSSFNKMRFHGNWRWFFDYGTGDLGNDGVHRLDVARWALETAIRAEGGPAPGWPQSVSALGGKYYFDDMQEWPDTLMVTYEYPGGYLLNYEMRIWTPYPFEGAPEGAAVYGDQGYIVIGNSKWQAFNAHGELVNEDASGDNTHGHVRNFLDCVKSRQQPAADLETVGHPSSALCHMGNAAWRVGRILHYDSETNAFVGDEEANRYLTREYREPWVLPEV
ncbi:MAG: gfo/Idh/MocA family oxidoreductase [Candidatus Omnitrophota bacterium]|jgi:predicted dehydrogenase|nr:MAG: gfo/Idh/MocA family oxidoreductase [Candidatus Omnitrophota bacterium]